MNEGEVGYCRNRSIDSASVYQFQRLDIINFNNNDLSLVSPNVLVIVPSCGMNTPVAGQLRSKWLCGLLV